MRPPTGTLIAATVNPADLVPEFAATADYYAHDAYMELIERSRVDDDLQMFIDGHGRDSQACVLDVHWFLDELQTILNDIAPDGFYFGSHWGDGADWGYWPVETCGG